MLTHDQNETLTRVEGDAPMGHLMREHYWIPAVLSSQLVADGTPVRVRLLGDDHVAFRTADGRIGFFAEGCPHRGCSLVLARNEDSGLRCIFHGWKIDVGGTVVDVPTHGANRGSFASKVPVEHYPTHEGGGIVWVWLGEQPAPPFPELPFTVLPPSRVWVTITRIDCNWLQGVEASLDSAHVGTLHQSYIARHRTPDRDKTIANALDALAPRYEVERTTYGVDAAALRALPDGNTYVRTTKYVLPFINLVPGSPKQGSHGVIFIASPIDDTHHNLFFGSWSETDDFNTGDEVPDRQRILMGDRPYDPHDFGGFSAGRDENFGQDREAMRDGHFSGFLGNLLQEDIVTQVSMGPIADRTREHLSTSDVAIVHARRRLFEALADAEAGRHPSGPPDTLDFRDVNPIDAVLTAAGQQTGD
jgi:phthalate 4,5-dioxygenase